MMGGEYAEGSNEGSCAVIRAMGRRCAVVWVDGLRGSSQKRNWSDNRRSERRSDRLMSGRWSGR